MHFHAETLLFVFFRVPWWLPQRLTYQYYRMTVPQCAAVFVSHCTSVIPIDLKSVSYCTSVIPTLILHLYHTAPVWFQHWSCICISLHQWIQHWSYIYISLHQCDSNTNLTSVFHCTSVIPVDLTSVSYCTSVIPTLIWHLYLTAPVWFQHWSYICIVHLYLRKP